MRGACEVAVAELRVAALEAVVELLPDRARELVYELARVDEVERPDPLAGETRRLVEERDVGLDLPRGARALHLDGDAPSVRERGLVHLADRRGGDRHRVELGEQALERVPELAFDDAPDVLERDRTDVILQRAQLDDDVGRNDVGTGREELSELHEGRPELVEHFPQMLAAPRARSLCGSGVREPLLRGPSRQEIAQLVRLEEIPEAMAHHHLRDLG